MLYHCNASFRVEFVLKMHSILYPKRKNKKEKQKSSKNSRSGREKKMKSRKGNVEYICAHDDNKRQTIILNLMCKIVFRSMWKCKNCWALTYVYCIYIPTAMACKTIVTKKSAEKIERKWNERFHSENFTWKTIIELQLYRFLPPKDMWYGKINFPDDNNSVQDTCLSTLRFIVAALFCCSFILSFSHFFFENIFVEKRVRFDLFFVSLDVNLANCLFFFSLNLRVRIQRTSKMPIRMFLFSSNFIDFVSFVCMQFRSFYIRLIYEFSLCSVDSTNCAKIKCFLTKTGKQHNFFNGLLSKNRSEWKKEWKNTDSQVLANTRWQKNTWNRAAE